MKNVRHWKTAYENKWFVRWSIVDKAAAKVIADICSLIVTPAFELFECSTVITKAPVYAVERISAVQKAGFTKAEHLLTGKDGYAYNGYWITEHK